VPAPVSQAARCVWIWAVSACSWARSASICAAAARLEAAPLSSLSRSASMLDQRASQARSRALIASYTQHTANPQPDPQIKHGGDSKTQAGCPHRLSCWTLNAFRSRGARKVTGWDHSQEKGGSRKLSLSPSPSRPPSLPPSLPLSLARAHRGLGGPELLVRLVTQQGTHAQRIVQPLRLLGQLAPQLGPLALEAAHSLPEQLQQRSGGHRDGTDRQQPSV
jgi:hypothetical protein